MIHSRQRLAVFIWSFFNLWPSISRNTSFHPSLPLTVHPSICHTFFTLLDLIWDQNGFFHPLWPWNLTDDLFTTVRIKIVFHYNLANRLQINLSRCLIAHSWGWAMGCLLWMLGLVHVLFFFSPQYGCIEYCMISHHVIMAPSCSLNSWNMNQLIFSYAESSSEVVLH